MAFKRFVEYGRVAFVNYGPDYGRLVVIVDIVDHNRALVDYSDIIRCVMPFKRLSLTDIKLDISKLPSKKVLKDAIEKAEVQQKWENSSWGRKLIVQKKRAALNDFDRYKLMVTKVKRAACIRREMIKIRKQTAVSA